MGKKIVLSSIVMLLVMTAWYQLIEPSSGESSEIEIFTTMTKEIQIHPGKYSYFTFDPTTYDLEFHKIPDLTDDAAEAVSMVPGWMRSNLTYKLTRLSENDQDIYADLILNSPDDRYIDEIAFVISHTSIETLTDDNFFPSLITDNARLIYLNDQYLDYVEVVEFENYTTLEYNDPNNITRVLDRDIYYWFVVHPKSSDEIPTYVDPNYNYANTYPYDRNHGVSPPTGKFWREWLFYENKTDQPLLKDKLEGVYTYYDAIGRINSWVGQSMRFTSDNERPVQPVRIYQKGIGRCGEHQDLRAAAAKAALIPVTCTLNPAEDHVWNEYFDGRWIHWDGGRENPLMYEKGWGKTLSTVWSWRGDGLTWSVTERYSEGTCNLTGKIMDYDGIPVEGADLIIATENYYDPEQLSITHWTSAGPDGTFHTSAGDGRNYYVRADGDDLGTEPYGNAVVQIVSGSEDGVNYSRQLNLPGSIDSLKYIEEQHGSEQRQRFLLDIDLEVKSSLIHGSNLFTQERYDRFFDYGYVDFFMANSENFQKFYRGEEFSGFNLNERVGEVETIFTVPDDDIWYGVISNEFSDLAMKTVNITIAISSGLEIELENPIDGEYFKLDDDIMVSGRSFSPWGVDNITVEFLNDVEIMNAHHTGSGSDPYLSRWEAVLHTVGLEPGDHTIRVTGYDGKNELVLLIKVNVKDVTPPNIEIRTPYQGESFIDNEMVIFNGTVSDNNRPTVLRYYFDDNNNDPMTLEEYPSNGSWEVEIDMNLFDVGTHTFYIATKDPSRNEALASVDFEIIEDEGPDIRLYGPYNNSIFRLGDPIWITGIIQDPSGLTSSELELDTGDSVKLLPLLDDDGKFNYTLQTSFMTQGEHSFEVKASDVFGNERTFNSWFVLDGGLPSIELSDVYNEEHFAREKGLVLGGIVSDDLGIKRLEIEIDAPGNIIKLDLTDDLDNGTFLVNITDEYILSLGEIQLELMVTDLAGWISTIDVQRICDAEEPSLHIFLPENCRIGDPLSMDLLIDDDTKISKAYLILDGEEVFRRDSGNLIGNLHMDIDTVSLATGYLDTTAVVVDIIGRKTTAQDTIYMYNSTSDLDGDGIPDWWEMEYGLNWSSSNIDQDTDMDGFSDLDEYLGDDGLPGGGDHSDPTKTTSVPVPKKAGEEESGIGLIAALIVLLMVVVIGALVLFLLISRNRKQQVPKDPVLQEGLEQAGGLNIHAGYKKPPLPQPERPGLPPPPAAP